MTDPDPRPFLVVTVLMDSSARPAALTRSHGDAVERAMSAAQGYETAGLDLSELAIAPKAFAALRKNLRLPEETVAIYDIFPLSSTIPHEVRGAAGQFLAAEALWALEEQGMLNGIPPQEKLDLPGGWPKDPKEIRGKLVEAGASQLGEKGATTFVEIKKKWDASPPG